MEVVADSDVEGSVAVDSGSADSSADPGVVRKKREVEVSCESSVAEDSAAEANPTVVDFRVEEAGEAVGKAVAREVASTTEVAAARTELLSVAVAARNCSRHRRQRSRRSLNSPPKNPFFAGPLKEFVEVNIYTDLRNRDEAIKLVEHELPCHRGGCLRFRRCLQRLHRLGGGG